jgi:hypothetical protein
MVHYRWCIGIDEMTERRREWCITDGALELTKGPKGWESGALTMVH